MDLPVFAALGRNPILQKPGSPLRLTRMRSPLSGVGRLLGSVALRYRHPCAAGVRRGGPSSRKSGSWSAIRSKRSRDGGGNTPRDERMTRLEAVFFLSQQPQTSRRLAKLAGLADGTKARTLVRTLNRRYDAEGSAFRVEEVAGGFQLMTRPKFAPWLRRLHATTEVRLSAPAMETLAVVAYRQPVMRVEIEAIRGVQSGEVLRQLVERDLVRIAGRSDELGRPFLYGTTKQFLQVFGLRNLDELPRADLLQRGAPAATCQQDVQINPDTQNPSNQSQVVEEETTVTTLIMTQPRQDESAELQCPTVIRPRRDDRTGNQGVFDTHDEDDENVYDEDEDELEDELDEEEEDDLDEEDDDEDLDDEPWEEVEEDDEDLDEEEDWDEDDEWDDEDEDEWEDDDDDEWEDEEEADKP